MAINSSSLFGSPFQSPYTTIASLQAQQSQLFGQLSSGNQLTNAGINPAGLALAEQLTTQVNGLDQAQNNIADALSLLDTAGAGLNAEQNALQQERQLAVQAGNGALSQDQLQMIQGQINQLSQNINDIANQTQFNTQPLLNGQSGGLTITGGGAPAENVTGINGVTNGTANINVTALGTAAQVTGAAPIGAGTFSGTGNITITGPNGSVNLTTTNGETVGQLVQQINGANIGVTANVSATGAFQLTTQQVGSNATVTVNATGSAAADLGITNATATGTNATAVVNGATFTGQGNQFNLTGPGAGSLLGLQFTAGQTGTTQVTVTANRGLNFQTGANPGQRIPVDIAAANTTQLGVANLDVTSAAGQQQALNQLDQAINRVSNQQALVGAAENALQGTQNNAGAAEQNQLAARSAIADTNLAQASTLLANSLVLQQFSLFAMQQQSNAFAFQAQLLGR